MTALRRPRDEETDIQAGTGTQDAPSWHWKVSVIQLTGYPVIESYRASDVDELEQTCPGCSVKKLSVLPTSLGKDAAPKIANFLRVNPKTKARFLSYDLLAAGLPAAAKAAGVTVPKTYADAPDAPGIQALQSGERTVAAAALASGDLTGAAAALHDLARLGEPPRPATASYLPRLLC